MMSILLILSQSMSVAGPYDYQNMVQTWMCVSVTTHGDEWWRHQMETFSASLAICVGNSPASGEVPSQRPVTRSFDVFFDLCLNKRLRKQSCGWWFETLSRPLWRHGNVAKWNPRWNFKKAIATNVAHDTTMQNLVYTPKQDILQRGSGFVMGPCGVWGRGLFTCLLYVSILLASKCILHKLAWKFDIMENSFLYCVNILIATNDIIILPLKYFNLLYFSLSRLE